MLDRVVVGGGRARTLFFYYLCLLYSTLHLLENWKLEYRRAERQRKRKREKRSERGLLLLHSSVVTTIYPTEIFQFSSVHIPSDKTAETLNARLFVT